MRPERVQTQDVSAQRLPASRRAGHLGKFIESVGGRCSTPSGITASGTLVGSGVLENPNPCSTPSGITASGTPSWGHSRPGPSCAQRLPASRRAGPLCSLSASDAHPKCSTPSGITASGTPVYAAHARRLNGSAQRLPASRRAGRDLADAAEKRGECSTPSGITASGTLAGEAGGAGLPVLNAFRHHGERDFVWPKMMSFAAMCSTPSGITASGTSAWRFPPPLPRVRAQRLPASRRAGLKEKFPADAKMFACSTPSGITASGTWVPEPGLSGWSRSAQRLPASRRAGPRKTW